MLTDQHLPHLADDRLQFRLSRPAGAAVGLALAVVMLAPLLFLTKRMGLQFLAVQIAFIGAIYFGFGIAEGTVRSLLTEFLVAGVFLAVGAVALWADSPLVLAIGYGAHAVWDAVHHPRAVTTEVRSWYPPFCIVFDVVVVAFILVWLPLSGTATLATAH
jgi:hypothetical protein